MTLPNRTEPIGSQAPLSHPLLTDQWEEQYSAELGKLFCSSGLSALCQPQYKREWDLLTRCYSQERKRVDAIADQARHTTADIIQRHLNTQPPAEHVGLLLAVHQRFAQWKNDLQQKTLEVAAQIIANNPK